MPSANTQPLYGFFLIPIVWIFGRSWLAVGLAQIVVAVATALLVYEIGRRLRSPGLGLVAALIATLQPYLVWHDVHLNREILDQLARRGASCCSRSSRSGAARSGSARCARRRRRPRDPLQHAAGAAAASARRVPAVGHAGSCPPLAGASLGRPSP